jgi:hypothetical protein
MEESRCRAALDSINMVSGTIRVIFRRKPPAGLWQAIVKSGHAKSESQVLMVVPVPQNSSTLAPLEPISAGNCEGLKNQNT